ncbi:hypothetical protein PIB30_048987 [Stylosanthes scabra]|uniref:Uncharacterized protein n=1 Tax=Stylosanthes scabra TaxID=79078 RepID=A0ABU6WFB1_9FABA|nr:hypothetical protein [Stylosanthes scabra]
MADTQGNDPRGVVREVEEAQMPHELDPLYNWVNRDGLGSPSTMTEEYLTELKNSGMICGGGEEERLYRVEVPRRGERVCGLNLEHPRVPHWLWVNEVMFTEFGFRIPFTSFQQRLLQRCFVAPSQFHPNAWSAIRCFELVMEFLELPQDPEVFLFLFTVFSPIADGKAKKGYMSVRPGKGRRIFGLYEESFHDFKWQYFKIFSVGDHSPFWLTLEGDASQFSSYWSKDAGVNYIPVSYRKLNDEQRDTADILLWLSSKQNLSPKAILGNPERARKSIVKMAGRNKTLANLRRYMVANPQGPIIVGPSGGQASSSVSEGGGSSTVGGETNARPEVSSPIREEGPKQQVETVPPSSLGKRVNDETITAQKRPRTSEGSHRDFCPMDRSFDASSYIENNFLGPRALGASLCQVDGDLKLLNQQKAEAEKENEEAETAKSKAEKDLETALADAKEKGVELQRLRDREAGLLADVVAAKRGLFDEKSRADQAEASLTSAEQVRQELVKLAEDFVKATEDNLKEHILLLAPDFDVSLIGAWKGIVDEVIVDPPPPEGQIVTRLLRISLHSLFYVYMTWWGSVVPCLPGSDPHLRTIFFC